MLCSLKVLTKQDLGFSLKTPRDVLTPYPFLCQNKYARRLITFHTESKQPSALRKPERARGPSQTTRGPSALSLVPVRSSLRLKRLRQLHTRQCSQVNTLRRFTELIMVTSPATGCINRGHKLAQLRFGGHHGSREDLPWHSLPRGLDLL